MGRSPCCEQDAGVKKGPWTPEEDKQLLDYIRENGGHGSWRRLPKLAGLNRCGKSCRLRWTNYLRPDIKRGSFTADEEKLIISLHAAVGNKWSSIATKLPGRTDNEIKNYWNTHLRKKLFNMGIDPVTHRPRTDLNILAAGLLAANANGGASTQPCWDMNAIKLQADAAKFQILQGLVRVLATATATPAAPGFDLMTLLAVANGGTLVGQQPPAAPASVDHHTLSRSRLGQYHQQYYDDDLPPLTTSGGTPPVSKVISTADGLLDSMVGGAFPAAGDGLSSPEPIGAGAHGGPSGSNRNNTVVAVTPPPLVEAANQGHRYNGAAATSEVMSSEPTPASSPLDGTSNAFGCMNQQLQDDDLINDVDSSFWKEILEQISLAPSSDNYSSEM
ncbi:hypothetical protein GUJ93_ZPchr0012g21373 [Zizania palustris]|uniref:Uncharacterized protein n=1 Tax=Zizania palustris TaxID=103762 RepID=A0A8J5WS75_ZIZPA|nr:hypothetical protein GUJ93_ZPchr0012g21373 [Zizania palustris]